MLSIKNLTVKFGYHTVFSQADYNAYKGKINIIQGKSGSGKSTLIQTLLFKHPCVYKYNDIDLSAMNEAEQEEFLYKHVSTVYQEPLFFEDLTVNENISFIKKVYNCSNEFTRLLNYLGIEKLADKYPAQLSGGERTRTALYIALLKAPDILILDEPTASLDEVNKKKVIRLLELYAQKAIVICSTHDMSLIETDSYNSCICNGKIHSDSVLHGDQKTIKQDRTKVVYREYSQLYKQFFRHHVIKNTCRILLLVSCVVALFISLSLNNVLMVQLKNALNKMSSTELIIYNPLYDNLSYSFAGWEFPVTDEQLEVLATIGGIEEIYPRYDLSSEAITSSNGVFDDIDQGIYEDEAVWPYELTEQATGKKVGSINYHHNCLYMAYNEERDYSEDVIKEFGDAGVFISNDLFRQITGQGTDYNDQKNYFLSFILPVPAYNISGSAKTMDPDDPDPSHPTVFTDSNIICGYPVKVTLPVRGVIDHSMGMGLSNTIYVPEKIMQQYISEIREEKGLNDHHSVVQSKTDNKEYEFEYTLWKPTGYSVIVEDLAHITDVISNLKKAGFAVDSDYINSKNILNVKESTRKMAIIISSVLLIIVLAAYFIIQYIRREQIVRQDEYLRVNGFNEAERNSLNQALMIRHAFIESVLAIVLFYISARILSLKRIAALEIDPFILAGIVLMIIIVDYIFPAVLRKKALYDTVQKY